MKRYFQRQWWEKAKPVSIHKLFSALHASETWHIAKESRVLAFSIRGEKNFKESHEYTKVQLANLVFDAGN